MWKPLGFSEYKLELAKQTLGACRSSAELLALVPLIPTLPTQLLAIVTGLLRYRTQDLLRSISGLVPNLWLGYPVERGKLSKMRAAEADEMTNAYFT